MLFYFCWLHPNLRAFCIYPVYLQFSNALARPLDDKSCILGSLSSVYGGIATTVDHTAVLISPAVVHHHTFMREVVGKSHAFLVEAGAIHFRRYCFSE
jgi:hypothetical protein